MKCLIIFLIFTINYPIYASDAEEYYTGEVIQPSEHDRQILADQFCQQLSMSATFSGSYRELVQTHVEKAGKLYAINCYKFTNGTNRGSTDNDTDNPNSNFLAQCMQSGITQSDCENLEIQCQGQDFNSCPRVQAKLKSVSPPPVAAEPPPFMSVQINTL